MNPLDAIFAEANKKNDALVKRAETLHADAKKALEECRESSTKEKTRD